MATKILCDGCDKDITDLKHDDLCRHGLRAEWRQKDSGNVVLGQFAVGRPFDLCGGCIEVFKSKCDPRQWPRCYPTPLQPRDA